MKPIGVKFTRLEKRGRKMIIVIESDLYSDETFAVNPHFDDGDGKNQLCYITFDLKITEKSGKLDGKVQFGNCLGHYTKGRRQLHKPISSHYLSKKDCTLDWFMNTEEEYYTEGRIKQILKMWAADKEFQDELRKIDEARKRRFKINAFNKAQAKYQAALENLHKCTAELTIE